MASSIVDDCLLDWEGVFGCNAFFELKDSWIVNLERHLVVIVIVCFYVYYAIETK